MEDGQVRIARSYRPTFYQVKQLRAFERSPRDVG